MIQSMVAEPEVGKTYEGPVKSTTAFGAFIEIMPGTEALLHISEMKWGRVEKSEDVVKKGDRVTVKLIDRDERGRLRLSMKALQPKPEGMEEGNGDRGPRGDRPPRREEGEGATEGAEGDKEYAASDRPRSEGSGGERGRGGRGGSGGSRGGRPPRRDG
jgi:polyribonucleotide nucleotidyltransferase